MYSILPVIAIFVFIADGSANNCVPRDFGHNRIVCVCNATYCDETREFEPVSPPKGEFYWYVSSKAGLRMSPSRGRMNSSKSSPSTDIFITVDSGETYQSIIGFGGAFTDSVGLNLKNLTPDTQDQLIRAYYSETGSRYNLGRVPIGGSDFSTRPYTYDDFSGDNSLTRFALAHEDYDYKIPFMRKAKYYSPETKFLGAAWSAPPWMKTNNAINGIGFLKKDHYQTYANYLVKFLKEYEKQDLRFWAISPGNEPLTILAYPILPINSMGWTPESVSDWAVNYLSPTLSKEGYKDLALVALDDQRFELPVYPDLMFVNEQAKKIFSGIATHWYWDRIISPYRLDETHNKYPDKFLLMTEACTGSMPWEEHRALLGSWERGEQYILDIIENLNHWVSGWVDWNLALNEQGGPNWVNNFVDSPIIVIAENDEFYKQPMYYAISHVSRFVPRGSFRIHSTDTADVKSTAFLTPSNETVVVLYNKAETTKNIAIKDAQAGTIKLELPPYSIHTVIYKQ